MPDMPMLIKLSKELDVSVDYLLGVQRSDETMEQIVKQIFSSGQKDQLDNVKQNCLAASNCLHTASGSFGELSANVKSILGIKKPSTAENS